MGPGFGTGEVVLEFGEEGGEGGEIFGLGEEGEGEG